MAEVAIIGYIGNGAVSNIELIDINEISLICIDRDCDRVAKAGMNWIRLRDPEIKKTILLGKPKIFCPKCRDKVKKPLVTAITKNPE